MCLLSHHQLLLLFLIGFAAGSWTQVGYNAARTSTAGNLSQFTDSNAKVAFRVSPPYKSVFFGTPVFDSVNNRLITGAGDGYFYALDYSNGTILWRTCVGKKGLFPQSPCTGFGFPSGVDAGFDSYNYASLLPDGSFVVVLPLADQTKMPPYGYSDKRDVVLRINGTNGMQIWNVTSGLFNPANADSASIKEPLVLPNGDILFWQVSNGQPHLVRLDWTTGKPLFNITGDPKGSMNFTYTDHLTYIEDDDTIWTSAQQDGGLVKLSASTGNLLFHISDNILDSMQMPMAPVYDSRTKLIHIARTGQSQVFAFNALTGEAAWVMFAWESGWPASASLCPKNTVLWWSDSGGLALWDAASAEKQEAIWQTSVIDPPPPARVAPASLDGRFVVSYGSAIIVMDCLTGKELFSNGFNTGDRSPVRTGALIADQAIVVNFGGELLKIVPSAE